MLYTVNNTNQSVETDEAISLGFNRITRNCAVTHSAGTASVSLNRVGLYAIQIDANLAATPATGGTLSIALYRDGTPITGAVAIETATSNTDIHNLNIAAPLVKVSPINCCSRNCNPVTITVVNTGDAATLSNIALSAVKIG